MDKQTSFDDLYMAPVSLIDALEPDHLKQDVFNGAPRGEYSTNNLETFCSLYSLAIPPQSPPTMFLIARQPYQDVPFRHDLGSMTVECPHCQALHWMAERLTRSSDTNPKFGPCCFDGKITLPLLRRPPRALLGLFTADDGMAEEFRTNIIQYNSAFAFTSLGANIDREVNRRFGPNQWVFKVQGQMRHLSGALEPNKGVAPSYSQLYLYDPASALWYRMDRN